MKSFAVVALILMSGFAYAQIPQTISYQGVLTDASGRTYLDDARYLRTCDANDQVVEARPNCW